MLALEWGLIVTAVVLAGVLAYWGLALCMAQRRAVLIVAVCMVGAAPLILPSDARLERLLVGLIAIVIAMKLWSLHVRAGRQPPGGFGPYMRFLLNPTLLVWCRVLKECRPTVRENLRAFSIALLGVAASAAVLIIATRVEWNTLPFFAEHSSKAVAVMLLFTAVMAMTVHSIRLCGGVARDFSHAPWLARTPADFWRRYNRSIGQFMDEHVFTPACRRLPAPVAILVAFLVSGLLHEYAFTIAVGRIQGWVTVFFLMQGVAVAATARLRLRGWMALPFTAGTLVFMVASSVLLFATVDRVARFYADGMPTWLRIL